MAPERWRTHLAAGASAVSLAFALVACGGSSGNGANRAANAPSAASSAAASSGANGADAGVAVSSAAAAATAPPPTPPAPVVVDPFDDAHYTTAARLDLDVIRQHPVGARMGKAIAKMDPLFALATKASGIKPLQDVDSVVWLGDGVARSVNQTQIVMHHVAEPTMRAAVVALAIPPAAGTKSDSATTAPPTDPAQPFDAKIGARKVEAMQPRPGLVVFVPDGKMDSWTTAFTNATFARNAPEKEAFSLRVKEPAKSFSYVPKTVQLGRMEVDSQDDGGVTMLITAECSDEAGAKATKQLMEQTIKKTNVFPIRLMTKNVLDSAKTVQTGSNVVVTITATKAQVEALARIVADELNTDME